MDNKFEAYGDYTLDVLDITVAGKKFSLKNIFNQFSIYESLDSSDLNGHVEIIDGNNLINNMPIRGFETIDVSFATKGKTKFITHSFVVYKISPIQKINESMQLYRLYFTTPEAIKNLSTKLSRHYAGTANKVVNNLLKTLDTTKPIVVGDTASKLDFVTPYWSPAQALNWTLNRVVDPKTHNTSFVFYESVFGYNYVSLEELVSADTFFTYTANHMNLADNVEYEEYVEQIFKNASSFDIGSRFDHIKNITNGTYGGRYWEHDIVTKKYIDNTFNRDLVTTVDNFAVTPPSYVNERDNNHGSVLLHTDRSSVKRENRSSYSRTSVLNGISQNIVTLTVSGNSDMCVGKVIEFDIPSVEPKSVEFVKDDYFSGRRLVTGVRHVISQSDYTMVLEVSKDSLAKELT